MIIKQRLGSHQLLPSIPNPKIHSPSAASHRLSPDKPVDDMKQFTVIFLREYDCVWITRKMHYLGFGGFENGDEGVAES
ncbi:hypothetical protein AVEN_12870-1 [Araneus ventricosus]|uniref:Uncharacterized protein n=1 Tax=Araneus ventricosus TaxID=182803 RepID=A0A4Y1ZV05_ARAVE|nr:hypothetical protein AVEN_12870-1 [Araneus ventricosus]